MPSWLEQDYEAAWQEIKERALRDIQSDSDPLLVRSILSVVALASGELKLGALLREWELRRLTSWRSNISRGLNCIAAGPMAPSCRLLPIVSLDFQRFE
jgi:hypothetical protein